MQIGEKLNAVIVANWGRLCIRQGTLKNQSLRNVMPIPKNTATQICFRDSCNLKFGQRCGLRSAIFTNYLIKS
jgi:hypothetical protein